MSPKDRSFDLAAFANETQRAYDAPALALGLLCEGEAATAVCGQANLPAGLPADGSTLFQIGSVTKVYTALLVMQLAEEGRLDIDAPVAEILPGLVLQSPDAAKRITPRHLMAHTSGMDGDYLMTARSDVARYVDRCACLPLLFPPGSNWSYSNSGYVLLGRLVEIAAARPWADALQERVFDRLGLSHSIVDPYAQMYHRIAPGHVESEDEGWQLADGTDFAQSIRPAGSFTLQSAGDLLAFARAAVDGFHGDTTLLSPEGWAAMAEPQIALPPHNALSAPSWGLGFNLHDDGSLGHAGGVPGAASYLTLYPKARSAHLVLTNGQGGRTRELLRHCRRTLGRQASASADLQFADPAGTQDPAEAAGLAGTYASVSARMEVSQHAETLHADITYIGADTPQRFTLKPIAPLCYATFDAATGMRGANMNFLGEDNGKTGFAFVAGRLLPRTRAQ